MTIRDSAELRVAYWFPLVHAKLTYCAFAINSRISTHKRLQRYAPFELFRLTRPRPLLSPPGVKAKTSTS